MKPMDMSKMVGQWVPCVIVRSNHLAVGVGPARRASSDLQHSREGKRADI